MTESDLRKIFSQNIKKYRDQFKWSQVQLAKKAGVSVNFINDIESEKKWASPGTMVKLANTFNIETYELLKPSDSFPDNFNSIIKKYTDNIHAAVDETRLLFLKNEEASGGNRI